jgi:wyosine [tRNA(Phe)-imidazoG37] synthetase (radical SAM superfamily)
LVNKLKRLTDTKIAVLTNGSLLWMPEVRKELINADIVMPNLDAGDEKTYQMVNRPHKDLSFEEMVNGLINFRDVFSEQYWLEIFLLKGITANDAQIEKLRKITKRISPDRIQFNTVTKPTWEYCPGAVSREKMKHYCNLFGNKAEVIADYNKIVTDTNLSISKDDLIILLKKKPCTLNDISKILNLNRMEIIKLIDELYSKEKINSEKRNGELYYWI